MKKLLFSLFVIGTMCTCRQKQLDPDLDWAKAFEGYYVNSEGIKNPEISRYATTNTFMIGVQATVGGWCNYTMQKIDNQTVSLNIKIVFFFENNRNHREITFPFASVIEKNILLTVSSSTCLKSGMILKNTKGQVFARLDSISFMPTLTNEKYDSTRTIISLSGIGADYVTDPDIKNTLLKYGNTIQIVKQKALNKEPWLKYGIVSSNRFYVAWKYFAPMILEGVYRLDWDFGDGTRLSGTENEVVYHQYTKAGTYIHKVTATDATGKIYNNSDTLIVHPGTAGTQ